MSVTASPAELQAEAEQFRKEFESIRDAVGQVIVGQNRVVEATLTAILCGGNVLLEGVPGLGKTELVKALSRVLQLDFQSHPVHTRPDAGRCHRHHNHEFR